MSGELAKLFLDRGNGNRVGRDQIFRRRIGQGEKNI